MQAVGALGITRLDPYQLGSMAAEAEQALLREGESENTVRSYRSALRYLAAWFACVTARPSPCLSPRPP